MPNFQIEEVAEENPDAIVKAYAHPLSGLGTFQAREMAFKLGLGDNKKSLFSGIKMFQDLYNVFMKYDADMLEINPLIVEPSGAVVALDAKMSIDSNAFFRHKELFAQEDEGTRTVSEEGTGRNLYLSILHYTNLRTSDRVYGFELAPGIRHQIRTIAAAADKGMSRSSTARRTCASCWSN